MDTNSNATTEALQPISSSVNEPLDPLRRVLVPIEKRMTNGNWVFRTSDNVRYIRMDNTGVIRRAQPKVNGKLAKKARRACQP